MNLLIQLCLLPDHILIYVFTPEDLEAKKTKKELRTFVIVADVNNESSPTTQMLRKDIGEESFEQNPLMNTTVVLE